ncbi:TetR/AcrR family transcriptional regulator [Kineosporia sp. NBRC 101731]|uniref:TetR/AcrR family transcriptional regulator n=1 Tax=Kineosporia sp. NBRC 101731 TaxID=3032199 RepID=UPI0024A03CDA|nr:TetR/AcrR family transcriptional regulator [Kineosporia sp. NBRC 101731]GLY29984.1 hypothetical protein Kisp02_33490 [Kineosporia sp. NBRC 101731]
MSTSSGRAAASAEPGEKKADRILQAAGDVFAAQGLGATLADVAARAGVGVATVYRRFENKDELILASYEIRFRQSQADVLRAIEEPEPWAGFVEFFEEGVHLFSQDRGFREFVVGGYAESVGWARVSSHDHVETVIRRHQQFMQKALEQMLQRCQEAGVVRDDVHPSDLLALTMAAVSSIDLGAQKDNPALHRRVIGVILDGLRPARDAPTPLPSATSG